MTYEWYFVIVWMQVQWWGNHEVVVDTQTLPYAKEFVWTFCTHRWQGHKNFRCECLHHWVQVLVPFANHHSETTWVKLSLTNFLVLFCYCLDTPRLKRCQAIEDHFASLMHQKTVWLSTYLIRLVSSSCSSRALAITCAIWALSSSLRCDKSTSGASIGVLCAVDALEPLLDPISWVNPPLGALALTGSLAPPCAPPPLEDATAIGMLLVLPPISPEGAFPLPPPVKGARKSLNPPEVERE